MTLLCDLEQVTSPWVSFPYLLNKLPELLNGGISPVPQTQVFVLTHEFEVRAGLLKVDSNYSKFYCAYCVPGTGVQIEVDELVHFLYTIAL